MEGNKIFCFHDIPHRNTLIDQSGDRKASVFQYFGSKKQLYIYLLEYCKKIIEGLFDKEALDSETDLFDRILASSRMKMEGLQNQPFILQFITSAWEETSPEVADTLAILTEEASGFRNDLVLREEV